MFATFEWNWGYGRSLGIVHVGSEKQRHSQKDSARLFECSVRELFAGTRDGFALPASSR